MEYSDRTQEYMYNTFKEMESLGISNYMLRENDTFGTIYDTYFGIIDRLLNDTKEMPKFYEISDIWFSASTKKYTYFTISATYHTTYKFDTLKLTTDMGTKGNKISENTAICIVDILDDMINEIKAEIKNNKSNPTNEEYFLPMFQKNVSNGYNVTMESGYFNSSPNNIEKRFVIRDAQTKDYIASIKLGLDALNNYVMKFHSPYCGETYVHFNLNNAEQEIKSALKYLGVA
jgi:hypothetical protein